eukprot:12428635-Alexandrium_andersonii.AAC.1
MPRSLFAIRERIRTTLLVAAEMAASGPGASTPTSQAQALPHAGRLHLVENEALELRLWHECTEEEVSVPRGQSLHFDASGWGYMWDGRDAVWCKTLLRKMVGESIDGGMGLQQFVFDSQDSAQRIFMSACVPFAVSLHSGAMTDGPTDVERCLPPNTVVSYACCNIWFRRYLQQFPSSLDPRLC